MIRFQSRRKSSCQMPVFRTVPVHQASRFMFTILLFVGALLLLPNLPTAHASGADNRGRVETRIPAAAKKRDLALINKFLDAVVQGKQIEARDLLNPQYSGAVGDETDRQISYASEKLPRLKIFGNQSAVIERVYYFQDVHKRRKHLRYYFVIYKPGMNQMHEVMKIELINYDNLYFLHNVWAPKKGSQS